MLTSLTPASRAVFTIAAQVSSGKGMPFWVRSMRVFRSGSPGISTDRREWPRFRSARAYRARFGVLVGHDRAGLLPADIDGDADHAVAVMAGQIRRGQVGGDARCFVGRRLRMREDLG